MKRRRLGCLTTGGLIALVISLILVGSSYALTRNQMFSPGALNAQASGRLLGGVDSHAELEQDCAACHSAPWDSTGMADQCLECHQNVLEELKDPSSLHGAAMSAVSDRNCRLCHTDHNGREAGMTQFLGGDFPHEQVGFSLQAHDQLDWSRDIVCTDCHQDGFAHFSLAVCIDCHQVEQAVFMAEHTDLFGAACLECHDGIETYGTDFDHDDYPFPLEGRHDEAACSDCHLGAVNLLMLQETRKACRACHIKDDAHQGELGKQCGVCHTPVGWTPAVFDHSATGFELVGGHAGRECEDCHQEVTFQGLDPACAACHSQDEPHQGQFGMECALCHTVFSWDEIHFDHRGDFAADCLACHQTDSPADHYPGQCSACHSTDAWIPAVFDHAVAGAVDCLACHLTDRPNNHFGGQCSACHSTSAWVPASFDHTFPLDHGGAQQRCELCHTSANYAVYTCYECHEHSAAEVRAEHEGISDLNNCIRCHWDGREHEDGGGRGDDDDDDDD